MKRKLTVFLVAQLGLVAFMLVLGGKQTVKGPYGNFLHTAFGLQEAYADPNCGQKCWGPETGCQTGAPEDMCAFDSGTCMTVWCGGGS